MIELSHNERLLFMRNLMYKFNMFMQGRYGFDQLNFALFVVALIVDVVCIFLPPYLQLINLISLALILFAIFRALSRNIYKRSAENRKVQPVINSITGWFKLTYKKFRDGRTHRYYKCPACKASLRVKFVKGTHTIKCPKCRHQFKKRLW